MEGGKKKLIYIFGYLLKIIIKFWRLVEFFSKSGEIGRIFSWKILPIIRNHIFQVRIWRKFASKRNAGSSHGGKNHFVQWFGSNF
jgi:hypothetical protein